MTGASKGIGKAIAASFLAEGARVSICARDAAVLAGAAEELSALGEVHHLVTDLGDRSQTVAFVEHSVEQLGGVDVVVSNVSAFGGKDFRSSFEVDIEGAQTLMRTALAHMEDHAGGNIICIGSRAGSVGVAWMPAYAAVKAATVSMVKSMAIEVARRGIRVNCVSPGDIVFEGGTWERAETENPKLYQAILRENPFRRLGRPEEIGDVVAFLASDRASFVTGANWLVDGDPRPPALVRHATIDEMRRSGPPSRRAWRACLG
ncbi:MAG: SDR family NAD(P)-dependent oxidoreductase [Ilumatobacteraceae bacterium]